MRLHSLLTLLATSTLACAHGPGANNDFEGRRVLLLGIDGCRADAVKKLTETGRAPNLQALIAQGAVTWNGFTGGEVGAEVPQDTVSGPGWTTFLTGVWRDRHGVADNKFRGHRIAANPHLLRVLKDAKPTAWTGSICNWPEVHHYIVGGCQVGDQPYIDNLVTVKPDPSRKGTDYPELDEVVTKNAITQLRDSNPDVLFVYFGNVDETGHAVTNRAGRFSPDNGPYTDALATVDGQIGQILATLRARPKFTEEKWLILASTDHGGRGTSHGDQTPEERTIWMIANGPGIAPGTVVPGPIPQTAIAPTVLRYLGVKTPEAWAAQPFALPASSAQK